MRTLSCHLALLASLLLATSAVAAEPAKPAPKRVKVGTRNIQPVIALPTTVGARQWIDLPPSASGIVKTVLVDVAQPVKRGDVLAVIGSGGKDTKLQSPIDGLVLQRNAPLGAYVNAGQGVLFTIVDVSSVKLELDLHEVDMFRVVVGMPVEATFAAMPDRQWKARLSLVSPFVSTRGHTVHLEAEAANQDGMLRIGMSGEARILLPPRPNALVVPRAAVLVEQGESFVYRVDRGDGGRARRTAVFTGLIDGEWIEVFRGLQDGDEVVVGTVQDGAIVP